MEYNVEQINLSNIRAHATFEDGCVKVVNKFGGEIKYNSIQVFANHWRFIEDKPKELLKPAVITFIKHFLALNDITHDQVVDIHFEDNHEWCSITIERKCGVSLDIELKGHLIDFDLIEDEAYYTLEELGIK